MRWSTIYTSAYTKSSKGIKWIYVFDSAGGSAHVKIGVRIKAGPQPLSRLNQEWRTAESIRIISAVSNWVFVLKERNFKEAFRFKDSIHSTKFCGKFDLKLSGSVWSNRKSFEKGGPPLPWFQRLSFNIIFFYLEICDAKRWSKRRAERKESLWLGYRMVPSNLKVLAKFGLSPP